MRTKAQDASKGIIITLELHCNGVLVHESSGWVPALQLPECPR